MLTVAIIEVQISVMVIFYLFLGNGCRKKVRTLKIKKVDDKPMVIRTKEKAKIHAAMNQREPRLKAATSIQ